MIIARGNNPDGGEVLILGLSRENLNRLKWGQPIRLSRKTHGEGVPEGWTILLMYGDTEGAIAAKLQADGIVGPETQIKIDPRLMS